MCVCVSFSNAVGFISAKVFLQTITLSILLQGNTQKGEGKGSRLPGLHPAIQKLLGEAPTAPLPTAEALSIDPYTSEHKTQSPTTDQVGEKSLSYQTQSTSTADNKATAGHHFLESTTPPSASQASDVSKISQVDQDEISQSPRLPSPKHLPPRPPDNPATIPQGRQRRSQSKRR